jgi:hypothetical protein
MRKFVRHLLLIVGALAFVSVSIFAVTGVPARAGEPCTHEHGQGTPNHHHHADGAGCLVCCLGACAAIPYLPPPLSTGLVNFAVTMAAYWEAAVSLSSCSIAPDPGPPRTIA